MGVAGLAVLRSELPAGLRVVKECIDVIEVDLGHALLERVEPAGPHNLTRSHLEESQLHFTSVRGAVKHAHAFARARLR